MVRFLADENFNNRIVRTLLRRSPSIDLLRIQGGPARCIGSGYSLVPLGLPVNVAADDILLLAECSQESEWTSQVLYIPLS